MEDPDLMYGRTGTRAGTWYLNQFRRLYPNAPNFLLTTADGHALLTMGPFGDQNVGGRDRGDLFKRKSPMMS